MEERNVYQDISQRTDGDVYIGVVGPVRTGKSTFIKRFMDALVLPNIKCSGRSGMPDSLLRKWTLLYYCSHPRLPRWFLRRSV